VKFLSKNKRFQFFLNEEEDVALIKLPSHPKKLVKGLTAKQIKLSEKVVLGGKLEIYIDFDKENQPISIEILTFD
jgi:hypothetical protein